MSMEERRKTITYKVIINDAGQYSIWAANQENPAGWNDVGGKGPQGECLTHIREVWIDMRPAACDERWAGCLQSSPNQTSQPASFLLASNISYDDL